ncbi:MAG: 30S ribosomal protein S24e [archaeon GB-1867-035]|mgnify:CR=1 FL=1|nr:30S ribosomal protein S24e [Candidatus Culexmicrobium profundum]
MSGEKFRIEIVGKRENPLIDRIELDVVIYHMGSGTPDRYSVRQEIASQFNVPLDCVYIRRIKTEYGIGRSVGRIHVYRSPDRARIIEPDYIIARDEPSEEKEEE